MEILDRRSAELKAGVSSGGNFPDWIQEGQSLKGEIRLSGYSHGRRIRGAGKHVPV